MLFLELIFKEHSIQFDMNATAKEVMSNINDILGNDNHFSHLIADGVEIYEEFEDFLIKNVLSVKKIEIVEKTKKEFVNDLLLMAGDYIKRAEMVLPSLVKSFYENPEPKTWEELDQLLGGIQWLDEVLTGIGISEETPSNWAKYLAAYKEIQEGIGNLAEALENEDNILIGDIVQYEMMPALLTLKEEIELTMDNEGTRYDLN